MVAAIDLGATTALAGYMASYAAPGGATHCEESWYEHADMHGGSFAEALVTQLNNGPVALGLEGPLWGITEKLPLGRYKPRVFRKSSSRRQFEKGATAWYGLGGAPAAAKAFVLLRDLLSHLKTSVPDLVVTYGSEWGMQGPPFKPEECNLLLWEAFVTGKKEVDQEDGYKPEDDVLDADANVRDAYFAVHHGYANCPAPPLECPPVAKQCTVPIAGAAIELAGLVVKEEGKEAWWNTPCLVIGPRPKTETQAADLLWP